MYWDDVHANMSSERAAIDFALYYALTELFSFKSDAAGSAHLLARHFFCLLATFSQHRWLLLCNRSMYFYTYAVSCLSLGKCHMSTRHL